MSNALYYLIGIQSLHEALGKMFEKDNPNFKPELWEL